MRPEKCTTVVHAAVILHNFLLRHGEQTAELHYENLRPAGPRMANRPPSAKETAKLIREKFVNLFSM